MNFPPSSDEPSRPDAHALWFAAAGEAELRHEPLPCRGVREVRIRTLFSGISRGTESLVFYGQVPEQEQQRMRGPHMGGDFHFPVKYGYAAVGVVEEGPDALIERHVFALHPHQSAFVVASDAVTLLPESLPPARAVLAANMETALNIVWDANILPGDRVTVFGAGVVGALCAFIAKQIVGTEVVLVDPNPARKTLAEALSVPLVDSNDVPEDCDVLINASASGAALQSAMDHAGFQARIVEASWYGDTPLTLSLGGTFHSKRLSLISSQVGAIPPSRQARWSYSRRLAKALELLCDDRLDALISGETDFHDIVEAYPNILQDPGTLCHRIRYTRN